MTIQTSKKRNAKSCDLHKTCCVCERTRYNTEFTSNAEGRTSVKPYCKHCKEIYEGIRKGLILERDYKGFDYNTEQLQGDNYGQILYLKGLTFEKINLDFAVRLVKQGMAHVTSSTTIERLITDYMNEDVKGDISTNSPLREHIFKRDNNQCHYCVRKGVTLDHVTPKFQGGLNTPLNLVACCKECNELKTNMSKHKFLTHLKQGDFDYFTQTWKPHVQIETYQKRCQTCGETKMNIEFAKQEVNCKTCEKIQPLLELGMVTKKQAKMFNMRPSGLKGDAIQVLDKEGELEVIMKKAEVKILLERGIVTVVDETTVQRVLSKQEEKRAYPRVRIRPLNGSGTPYVTSLEEFVESVKKNKHNTQANTPKPKTGATLTQSSESNSLISQQSLDYIKTNYLTCNTIALTGNGQEPVKRLTQQQALNLVQKRIVHIVKANVVKLVMDEQRIQSLYPNFVFEDANGNPLFELTNTAKTEPLAMKQPTTQSALKVASETKAHALLTKTHFTLSARDQFNFRFVPRETVISLVEQGIVKVELKNQPRLPLTKDETLQRYASLEIHLQEADFMTQLEGSCIGVFDQKNAVYATVPKEIARQLVSENYAKVVKRNRIKFTQLETVILTKFPALHQYKMYKEEDRVKLNAWTIKVTDSNSNNLKKIQLNEAIELAKEKKADILALNKIKIKELKNA